MSDANDDRKPLTSGKNTMMRHSLALLLVVSTTAAAQQPSTPTFEVGIEVINLTVSVTDNRARYVTDLKTDDFAIFEDGVKQELSIFRHDDIPISLALVVDTSASMDEKLPVAQQAASRFIKTLRPQDQAQVMQFNDLSLIHI